MCLKECAQEVEVDVEVVVSFWGQRTPSSEKSLQLQVYKYIPQAGKYDLGCGFYRYGFFFFLFNPFLSRILLNNNNPKKQDLFFYIIHFPFYPSRILNNYYNDSILLIVYFGFLPE